MEQVSSSSASEVEAGIDVRSPYPSPVHTVLQTDPQSIVLPQKTLIVLCGPAGAGKSTFARRFVEHHLEQGYRPTSIVSSDRCRALLCDDENSQQYNRDTFELFYFLLRKRLSLGCPTIADSTALQPQTRQTLLEIARRFQVQTCLFIFNMSLQTCMRNDQHQARGRIVGEQVITYHLELLHKALPLIPDEGWDQIYTLDEKNFEPQITIT